MLVFNEGDIIGVMVDMIEVIIYLTLFRELLAIVKMEGLLELHIKIHNSKKVYYMQLLHLLYLVTNALY